MKKNRKLIILFVSVFLCTLIVGGGVLFWVKLYQDISLKMSDPILMKEQAGAPKDERVDAETNEGEIAEKENAEVVKLPGAGAQMGELDGKEQAGGDEDVTDVGEDEDTNLPEEADETDGNLDSSEKHAVLTFGGDVCFHDAYSNMGTLASRGGRMQDVISADLLQEMIDSDVCMVNNEFPYSRRGAPLPEKMYAFRSKPENVKLLSQMGVDIVGIANNHAFDHGEDAFLDTLDTLDEAGVKRVGGGRNLDEASQPVFFEVDGIKIGYLAATQIERNGNPDTRGATEDRAGVLRCFSEKELNHFLDVITQTKQECDFLVVFIHWGTESTDVLDWAQPYQADLITKAGADIIVGGHPHVLQGLDIVNGIPVIYSLGNYWFNSKTMDTMLLKVELNGAGIEKISLIPAVQSGCVTRGVQGEEKQRILNYLQSLSPNLQISQDGVVSW